MKKVIILAAGLLLALSAPVAAGGYCPAGGCKPPPPPPPPVLEPEAAAIVCGDPRLWVQIDNTASTVAANIKIVSKHGDKTKVPARRVIKKTVADGSVKVIGPRWTRGNGAMVRVWSVDEAGRHIERLLAFELRSPVPWGEGVCPADRFGEPDWSAPHYSTVAAPHA